MPSSSTSETTTAFWLGLFTLFLLPLIAVVALPALFLRAWVASVLWGWFAPWPLRLSLLHIVGLMLAYSVVFARDRAEKDERSTYEKFVGYVTVNAILPLAALAIGWLLTFFR